MALLSLDGQRRWRRDLGAAVTGLTLWGDGRERGDRIAAGTSGGWVVLLSPEGDSLGCHRMEAGVRALVRLDLPDGRNLLVATEPGVVAALAPK